MFNFLKKPAPAREAKTIIQTSRDFGLVSITMVDKQGNQSFMAIRKPDHALVMEGETEVMVGAQSKEDLFVSRDYFAATSPEGLNTIRHIDAVLKHNKMNVTRFMLTHPYLPRGEGLDLSGGMR